MKDNEGIEVMGAVTQTRTYHIEQSVQRLGCHSVYRYTETSTVYTCIHMASTQ